MKRKYGSIPSIKPLTVKHFSASKYKTETELPDKVDLRQYCSPVEDQGQQGSCTAHAIVGLREYLEIKAGKPFVPLSRAFLYYEERLKEGDPTQDAGAMPIDGMDVLKSKGVCPEKDMPYSDQDYTTVPTTKDITDAVSYKIDEYQSVPTTALMKAALAEGHPVVIGIQVYESFESDAVAQNGIIPVPNTNMEQLLGGHCMLAIGYDMTMLANGHREYVIVKNSWGNGWGDKGYCYIPFAYFWHPDLVSDYWIGTIAQKEVNNTVNLQDIEEQVLELLVTLIKADGPALAQQFLDELVKLIEGYIPDAGLSKLEKVSWVDIRNALEKAITQDVLQAIVALIAAYGLKV